MDSTQHTARHLPVLGNSEPTAEPRPRHPAWIKARLPSGKTFFEVRDLVHGQKLHTVCESASCPNIGECWSRRAITIMILGNICTRSCQFCDVPTGRPLPPDPDEPRRVALALKELGLRHTVITCVDRDDLKDGGASHWAETIRQVREHCDGMTLEVLTGDFKGNTDDVDTVLAAGPDVFAHNLETVPRLSRQVRVQASYPRSYKILAHAKSRGAVTKTGLMLGLGETREEIEQTLRDARAAGCAIFYAGQYLQPSPRHLPVARYVEPAEFGEIRDRAYALGFGFVASEPLVRSSYHEEGQTAFVRAALETR